VFESARGEDGIELAMRHRPHAVLVDIGLPGLDGYSVARRVRAELGTSVRLVALTGYGSARDRMRSFDAGFDEHITKPTTFDVLCRVLVAPSAAAATLTSTLAKSADRR
jgi:DNA-binding response OmpR family regulator